MYSVTQDSGGAVGETDPSDAAQVVLSALPFGQPVPLASVSGSVYATAQLLVQQVAFVLSDKIYAFSPETFDLDTAAKQWATQLETNVHDYVPTVLPLQTRTGAGAFALGYIFSPDFDVTKRHIPQSLLAPSGSLQHMRAALDQVSLLYGLSSPLVAHIAAIDFCSSHGLVSNLDTAMRLAEDIGLALIASSSTHEAQHISLLSTLLAILSPTLHLYDGIRVARETVRVVDALGEEAIGELYNKLAAKVRQLNPRLDVAGKALELLRLFNHELGTVYEPFEYHGHETPDLVLVTFGSVESQVAKATLTKLAADGAKVGVVNVRLYRPFIDEAFLRAVPASTRTIAVLGQIRDDAAVEEEAMSSALYGDVLTAVAFSGLFDREPPRVLEVKYSPAQVVTPRTLVKKLYQALGTGDREPGLPSLVDTRQYTFWDVDPAAAWSASVIGRVLSRETSINVHAHTAYDNLILGGVVRTDVRVAQQALEAPYEVDEANVVVIGDERLLHEVDILKSLVDGGTIVLKLPNVKLEELDKRLSTSFRKKAFEKGAHLFVLDLGRAPAFEKDDVAARLLTELSFFKIARSNMFCEDTTTLISLEGYQTRLQQCLDAIDQCLSTLSLPAAWGEAAEAEATGPVLPTSIQTNSFACFRKQETEEALELGDWQFAAKGIVFKEAYETHTKLRPDLAVKTASIRVKENRRLTPREYDRNIFHIEFDLGDSGLSYDIGEALGIHAENDEEQVRDFIESYGLDANRLVQVPARDNASALEVRTVQQALRQNVDVFGKPPKCFYEALAGFATDEGERKKLEELGGAAGAAEFKRRSEVDTATYADVLDEFRSARPGFGQLVQLVGPLKRREYSIASAQAVTPTSVALMVVVVDWVDSRGRTRYGQATRYLSRLQPEATVTASVKRSVMKLPDKETVPLIMAGLGTGLAPFRAFVQHRAMQKAQGKEIGPILLYLGARHQREEYLYGEEWEAYLAAGVLTLIGSAFSRDQANKIYIQDRMRQTLDHIIQAYVRDGGNFYLCGPTWPVPDVTAVLQEAMAVEAKASGKKLDPSKELEKLKEEGRYVLEVY